jgi:hypothetical protein
MSKERNKEENVIEGRLIRAARAVAKNREAAFRLLSSGTACGVPEILRWKSTNDATLIAQGLVVDAIGEVLGDDWSPVVKKVKEQLRKLEAASATELKEATTALINAGYFSTGQSSD